MMYDVCEQAFGSKHQTKEGVFLSHGTIVARMFARGTQGRADYSRSLKAESHELLEQHGPKMLSSQQMGTLRATSVKRGLPKAALAAKRSPSRQRVTLRSVARDAGPGSSNLAPVPKRARPTTRSLAPGKRWQAASVVDPVDEKHAARTREEKRVARVEDLCRRLRLLFL